MTLIYLDYAATTPLDPRVKKAMQPYWSEDFGNPSSLHDLGRRAKKAINEARSKIAATLHCRSEEIVFTGGGTEAINLAILGAARYQAKLGTKLSLVPDSRGHLITTKIEHHAVLRSMEELEQEGYEVTYIEVSKGGLVNPKNIAQALRPDTILVSVMYANNEIGTVQPIADIGKIIKTHRSHQPDKSYPLFFTDACQAAGYLDLNVEKSGVDMLAINGSKIYGPKGVGALYVRKGVKLEPLIYGGGQERGFRSGTENVPAIVGLAKALEIAEKEKRQGTSRLGKLRDYFIKKVLDEIPEAELNGDPEKRLPNNVNISIPGLEGEVAVVYLDERGVACSTGAACSSVEVEPSHVILALGKSREHALGSLRFTLGRHTKKQDIDYAVAALIKTISILCGRRRKK